MNILVVILVTILSSFSVVVMSYVAMATPLGPWIEPTVVLCIAIILKLMFWSGLRSMLIQSDRGLRLRTSAIVTAGSSIGGIMATGMGFSFPTLYFLDPALFNSWMQQPLYLAMVVSGLALAGSLFGFWIANVLEDQLLIEQRLMFPIGQLAYRMILAQNQARKAAELAVGFAGTILFCVGQYLTLIPRGLVLLSAHSFRLFKVPLVRFDFFPMYFAIGFVTGHMIALPLLVGTLTKVFVVDFLNHTFFPTVVAGEFMLAFCSGLIVVSTLVGLSQAPKSFWETIRRLIFSGPFVRSEQLDNGKTSHQYALNDWHNYLGLVTAATMIVFFWYFKFSILVLIYLAVFTFICVYQVVYIAGRIGLAQLGRFATFVMLPAIFFFSLNVVQIVLIATFVEIAAGVATDTLFGFKLAQLSGVPREAIKRYQILGILVSVLVIGFIFWALIHKFGLGSAELFAQRAQTRALLINITKFNSWAIILGAFYAYLLTLTKVNPMLALSGLLMPINMSLGLVAGGVGALLVKQKEEWYPFWSGVFAAHSIWMVISALMS